MVDNCWKKHGYPIGYKPSSEIQAQTAYFTHFVTSSNNLYQSGFVNPNSTTYGFVTPSLYQQALAYNPFQQALAAHHSQHCSSSSQPSSVGSVAPAFYTCNSLTSISYAASSSVAISMPQINFTTSHVVPPPAFAPVVHSVMNSLNVAGIHSPWILDTGATNHVTNSLHWFLSYKPVTYMFVNLPDRTTT